MKKYRLTDETKTLEGGTVLYRIEALCDIPLYGVHKGDKGGFVQSEFNLRQDGDCWVGGQAIVCGKARVSNDASVMAFARVSDNASVFGNALVFGDAVVYGEAVVCDGAEVGGHARVFGNARIGGEAIVFYDAFVYGDAEVYENARVCNAVVHGKARVYGDAVVDGNPTIYGDAKIGNSADFSVFRSTWSSCRRITYTRSNKMWWAMDLFGTGEGVVPFYGTGDELVARAYKMGDVAGKCYEATVKYAEGIYADMEHHKGKE